MTIQTHHLTSPTLRQALANTFSLTAPKKKTWIRGLSIFEHPRPSINCRNKRCATKNGSCNKHHHLFMWKNVSHHLMNLIQSRPPSSSMIFWYNDIQPRHPSFTSSSSCSCKALESCQHRFKQHVPTSRVQKHIHYIIYYYTICILKYNMYFIYHHNMCICIKMWFIIII